jgi:hypothetical protein
MRKTSASVQRVRMIVVGLLVLNLIAAGLVLYPPGGSAETLEQQSIALRTQIQQGRSLLEETRAHAGAVEKGRKDGDQFISQYFLPRRAAYIAVLSELGETARKSHLKERENAFSIEPVEGSDTLNMMNIVANYEGTYRSPLLIVIDSLNAAPQAGSNTLVVSMKIDAFVREDGSGAESAPKAVASAAPPEAAR